MNNRGDCLTPNHRLVCFALAHRWLLPTAQSWLTFGNKHFIGLTPCQRPLSMRLLLCEIDCAIKRQPGSPWELNTGQKHESPLTSWWWEAMQDLWPIFSTSRWAFPSIEDHTRAEDTRWGMGWSLCPSTASVISTCSWCDFSHGCPLLHPCSDNIGAAFPCDHSHRKASPILTCHLIRKKMICRFSDPTLTVLQDINLFDCHCQMGSQYWSHSSWLVYCSWIY